MAKKRPTKRKFKISSELQEEVSMIIDDFNKENIQNPENYYIPRYHGKFAYLDRCPFGNRQPVARLTYTGSVEEWEFAVFKWSSETYDADEFFFPGAECVDGSVQGGLKAGMRAYPISDHGNSNSLFSKMGQVVQSLLLGKDKK